jgi:hypothetical protein
MHGVKTFTIVTKSYLAFAKALAFKVNQFHPGTSFTIFVVDPEGMGNAATGANADIRSAADLFEDDTFRLMTSYYTADELCNACKPWAHAALLHEESTSTTLYLDADIFVTGSLASLLDDLGGKAILLTPHVIKPLADGVSEDLERAFLNGGIFNGGCLALNQSAHARVFLEWWKHRLRFQCLRFVPGLCVDQSWLNFVPALFPFEMVAVCRRPGVNVGHWNLHERKLTFDESEGFKADGDPVAFVHFSGWDWRSPEVVSKYALTEAGASREGWAHAGRMFRDLLVEQGIEKSGSLSYSYGKAFDGSDVDQEMRRRYLSAVKAGDCDGDELFRDPSRFRPQAVGLMSKLRRSVGLEA